MSHTGRPTSLPHITHTRRRFDINKHRSKQRERAEKTDSQSCVEMPVLWHHLSAGCDLLCGRWDLSCAFFNATKCVNFFVPERGASGAGDSQMQRLQKCMKITYALHFSSVAERTRVRCGGRRQNCRPFHTCTLSVHALVQMNFLPSKQHTAADNQRDAHTQDDNSNDNNNDS